jgi:hypothetical protein
VTAIVFTGPTISAAEAREELDAVYLPPVAQGDLYRAITHAASRSRTGAPGRPRVVGIIDGYFERVPAVWHKEILWAMNHGVHVFGSASMGALRAAELNAFGMEGVGKIYDAYRSGELDDDDEVAVVHGSFEAGYRGQSEAMVNIRATLARALQEGIIGPPARSLFERIAKGLFYPERSYPLVFRLAREAGIGEAEIGALGAWLPHGRVDQKRRDAIAMLREMRRRLEQRLRPKRVKFAFEHTVYWEQARIAAVRSVAAVDPGAESADTDALLDELRLEGRFVHAMQAALGRFLAVDNAGRQGVRVDGVMLQETVDTFRRERDLLTPEAARRWEEENQVDGERLRDFLEAEALQRWAADRMRYDAAAQLMDALRSTGDYVRLAARASDKQHSLEARNVEDWGLADAGLTEEELHRWYFEGCLGRPVAADVVAFARRQGFRDIRAFRRTILREFLYRTHRCPA